MRHVRVLALAASIAFGSILAAAAPAAAGGERNDTKATVDTASTCDSYEVTIDPGDTRRTWRIEAATPAGPWSWGGTAPVGEAPGNGWIEANAHTVILPPGSDPVDVAWWHGKGDPDPEAAYGWKTVLDSAGWQHPGGDTCGLPQATVMVADCELVELQFTNPTPFLFSADVRVDGEPGEADQWSDMEIKEGPLAGEKFGDRYRQVDIAPSRGERFRVQFDPGSGEHTVEFAIARGAEQRWYVAWETVTVDCGEPTPSPIPGPPVEQPGDAELAAGSETLPDTAGLTTPLLAVFAAGAFLFAGGGLVVVTTWMRNRRVRKVTGRA